MSKAREEAVAAPLPNGGILIAGGESPPNGGVLNDAELFDPRIRTFSNAAVGSIDPTRSTESLGTISAPGRAPV